MAKKNGGSLVEVLIIVAVVAIVTSLIVPAVERDRNEAKKADSVVGSEEARKARFVHSQDIGVVGMYLYLIRDTSTNREYLLARVGDGPAIVELNLTPVVKQAEKTQ